METDEADASTSQDRHESQMKEGDVINIVLAFCIRHNLSKVAVGDLLDMLRVLGVTKDVPVSRYALFKSVLEDISERKFTHFYCSK